MSYFKMFKNLTHTHRHADTTTNRNIIILYLNKYCVESLDVIIHLKLVNDLFWSRKTFQYT